MAREGEERWTTAVGAVASAMLSSSPVIPGRAQMALEVATEDLMAGRKLPHGELEAMVMGVLWDSTEPLVPAAVRDRLAASRPLAYTTVMTILVRLWEKGLLERERVGRAFAYSPTQSREEQTAQRMGELLAATGDESVVLSRFVASLPPERVAELRRALGEDNG